MKIAYGLGIWIGLFWGLALASGYHRTALFLLFTGLLIWAVICREDELRKRR